MVNKQNEENYFSKGFKFAAGIILFIVIFLFFFRPSIVIGPVDSDGKVIIPKENKDDIIYSSIPVKEVGRSNSDIVKQNLPPQKKCPYSCDDRDDCTLDKCSSSTEYECIHEKKSVCCGNKICEKGEDPSNCGIDCNCMNNPDFSRLGFINGGITLIGIWLSNEDKSVLNLAFTVQNNGCKDYSNEDVETKYYLYENGRLLFEDVHKFVVPDDKIKSGQAIIQSFVPLKEDMTYLYVDKGGEYTAKIELYYKGEIISTIESQGPLSWQDQLGNPLS